MSRTNMEYLFQVTAPVGDRPFGGPPRSGNLTPPFDDHLSQASATTLNEAGKTARRDDDDYAGQDNNRSAGESAADDDRRPADSAPSEAAAASTTPGEANHDDAPEDDQSAVADNATAEPNAEEPSSGVVEGENPGGEPEEQESDKDDDALAVQASAIATAAATTVEALTEVVNEVEPIVAQNQVATDAVDEKRPTTDPASARLAAKLAATDVVPDEALAQGPKTLQQLNAHELPADAAAPKKTRSATKAAEADGISLAHRETQAAKRRATPERSGDASAQVELAKAANDQAKTDELPIDQQLLAEQDKAADEPSRDSTARTSSRSRADAAVIASKVAASAIANGVVAQPTGDDKAKSAATDDASQAVKMVAGKGDALAVVTPRLQTNQLGASRAGRASHTDDVPRVDAARFVGRVAKAFHTAHERGGTLQLRLSPPELGSLRMELSVKDGVMTASLETETASARRVLLDHLPALRDRLAEQNIRVERFDVDVRREGSGGQADPRTSQDHQQPQQDNPEQRRSPTRQQREETPRHSTPIVQPLTNNTGINLVA